MSKQYGENNPGLSTDAADTAKARPEYIVHDEGQVELADESCISSSFLYNHDLAPVPVAKRNWSTYNFATLWMGMSANIPTYMLASGLIAEGMNWWQAVITIFAGNAIVLIPILLNSHPGTKYGIPFPVFARAAYGTIGSNLPALMRAIVACGWFGIQAWIGGQALFTVCAALIPGWKSQSVGMIGGHLSTEWLCFGLFWALNIAIIYKGMDWLKKVEGLAAPFVVTMTGLLLIWAVYKANGFGYLVHDTGKFHSLAEFLPFFGPALTAMVGSWSTLALNMPDFTRFGHSQREQAIGQTIALPTTMTLFAGMGVLITSAAVVIFPNVSMDEIWDPVKLIGHIDNVLLVAIAMFTIVLATLCVNIAANVVSPANDFANAFPRWISFRTGALITGFIGIMMQPWKLIADPNGYIFTWLLGYGGGLGSIAGVLVVDYWILRKKKLDLASLYLPEGDYRYSGGWNWAAILATLLGCGLAWGGLVVDVLRPLYDYAWFVGLASSSVVYILLMKLKNDPKLSSSH